MSIQIDFIIAIGLFFMMFLLVLSSTNSYFATTMETTHISELRANSEFLIDLLFSVEGDMSITSEISHIDTDILPVGNGTWPSRPIKTVSSSKVSMLEQKNYNQIKDTYNLDDFHITLDDILDFGDIVPSEGDVVTVYKPVWYNGGSGNLIVYSW